MKREVILYLFQLLKQIATTNKIMLQGVLFIDCDFSNLVLNNIDFLACQFVHCSFAGAKLEGSAFLNSDISDCDFTDCPLNNTRMVTTGIAHVDLVNVETYYENVRQAQVPVEPNTLVSLENSLIHLIQQNDALEAARNYLDESSISDTTSNTSNSSESSLGTTVVVAEGSVSPNHTSPERFFSPRRSPSSSSEECPPPIPEGRSWLARSPSPTPVPDFGMVMPRDSESPYWRRMPVYD